jgi:hypothetical protein
MAENDTPYGVLPNSITTAELGSVENYGKHGAQLALVPPPAKRRASLTPFVSNEWNNPFPVIIPYAPYFGWGRNNIQTKSSSSVAHLYYRLSDNADGAFTP